MHLFFDLEQTLIHSWDNIVPMNHDLVEQTLREHNTRSVHLFSFAIYDQQDQDTFVKIYKPMLETEFGIRILTWPSIQEMMHADTKITGVQWHNDLTEFISMRLKEGAFRNWCKFRMPNQDCALLDDSVENMTVNWPESGHSIKFIRA